MQSEKDKPNRSLGYDGTKFMLIKMANQNQSVKEIIGCDQKALDKLFDAGV